MMWQAKSHYHHRRYCHLSPRLGYERPHQIPCHFHSDQIQSPRPSSVTVIILNSPFLEFIFFFDWIWTLLSLYTAPSVLSTISFSWAFMKFTKATASFSSSISICSTIKRQMRNLLLSFHLRMISKNALHHVTETAKAQWNSKPAISLQVAPFDAIIFFISISLDKKVACRILKVT